MQDKRYEEIKSFLEVIYDVIDKSYAIEFGLNAALWLDPNHPVTIERAGLFTKAKDAYDALKHSKAQIDKLVKSCNQTRHPTLKNFSHLIDVLVADYDGTGRCLQDATHNLSVTYDYLVEQFGIGKLFVFDRANYKKKEVSLPVSNTVKTFFKQPLPERTLNRPSVEALMPFTTNENPVIASASQKMICILKKVPDAFLFLNEAEKWELTSGKLSKIINKLPEAVMLLNTYLESIDTKSKDLGNFDKEKTIKNCKLFSTLSTMEPDLQSHPSFLLSQAIHENDLAKINTLLGQYDVAKFEERLMAGQYVPPLHIAAEEGKIEIVRVLLDKGFNCNLQAPNNGWRTALCFAAEFANHEIIALLITRHADLAITDNFGKTPLEWLPKEMQNENSRFSLR